MLTNFFRVSAFLAAFVVGAATTTAVAQEEQQQGGQTRQQDTLVSTHESWEIRCADESRCYMTQTVYNDTGRPVLVTNIIKLAQPQTTPRGTIVAVADILTPLGVILPEGLRMRIDEGELRVTQFDLCNPLGCLSRAPLQTEIVDNLKAGGQATFLVSVPNQTGVGENSVVVSLSGFTAAYDALTPVTP